MLQIYLDFVAEFIKTYSLILVMQIAKAEMKPSSGMHHHFHLDCLYLYHVVIYLRLRECAL